MGKRTLSLSLVTFMLGLVLFTAPDSSTAGEPTMQVKGTIDAVIDILNNRELKKPEKAKERRIKIRQTIEKRFDFEEMAKRSLARHWKDRTPAEQREFVSLYSDLLENTYIRKIERFEDQKVVYLEEKTDGDYAAVKTRIIDSKGSSVPVEYRIFREKDRWEVYDIIIEGVSLVNNYRTQFTQIIQSGSYETLIRRLREKVIK